MNGEQTARYCAFCGLPIPSRFALSREHSSDEIDYCCSGCRAVASVDQAALEHGKSANTMLRLGLAIFFTMNVMVFTMALWSQDIYPDQSFTSQLSLVLRSLFRWASLVFSAPVLWLLGGPIARGVWQALGRRAITTDLLILLGVGAAYGYSVVSVLRGAGHVYFEVGSMVLVFVSLGRWLEAKGKRRTTESLDALADLLPATVRRLDKTGAFQDAPRQQVVTGDLLRVLPGERLPADGRITAGDANIDQQMVTGESVPSVKTAGDKVYSGTLNLDGDLRIEVTAADGKETVSRLIDSVRTARRAKGRQELLADRITAWFVPLVCLIAVSAGWYQGQSGGIDQGILTVLAVVLIACPCALGLATPMAIWTALGRAAECGVLFRSGMVMQQLAVVRLACFDKTGTLTRGSPAVGTLIASEPDEEAMVLKLAATTAAGSNHPLSRAITSFADDQLGDWHPLPTSGVANLAGRGLRSEIAPVGSVTLGSRRLMDENKLDWPGDLKAKLAEHELAQQVLVSWGNRVRGAFCFTEMPRPEAAEAVRACRQLGLELHLLTGDDARRAVAIGQLMAIKTESNQLPDEKVAAIKALAARGSVAMIGDGLNDAPALAAADVGVALGCGADVSRDAAGVCLLADDLRRFPWAVGLARQANRVVKQNLFWAFTYNCLGIALAATGRLNPIWAALMMAVSSLLVIANSLRLSHYSDAMSPSMANASNTLAKSRSPLSAANDASSLSSTTELATSS